MADSTRAEVGLVDAKDVVLTIVPGAQGTDLTVFPDDVQVFLREHLSPDLFFGESPYDRDFGTANQETFRQQVQSTVMPSAHFAIGKERFIDLFVYITKDQMENLRKKILSQIDLPAGRSGAVRRAFLVSVKVREGHYTHSGEKVKWLIEQFLESSEKPRVPRELLDPFVLEKRLRDLVFGEVDEVDEDDLKLFIDFLVGPRAHGKAGYPGVLASDYEWLEENMETIIRMLLGLAEDGNHSDEVKCVISTIRGLFRGIVEPLTEHLPFAKGRYCAECWRDHGFWELSEMTPEEAALSRDLNADHQMMES